MSGCLELVCLFIYFVFCCCFVLFCFFVQLFDMASSSRDSDANDAACSQSPASSQPAVASQDGDLVGVGSQVSDRKRPAVEDHHLDGLKRIKETLMSDVDSAKELLHAKGAFQRMLHTHVQYKLQQGKADSDEGRAAALLLTEQREILQPFKVAVDVGVAAANGAEQLHYTFNLYVSYQARLQVNIVLRVFDHIFVCGVSVKCWRVISFMLVLIYVLYLVCSIAPSLIVILRICEVVFYGGSYRPPCPPSIVWRMSLCSARAHSRLNGRKRF